MNSTGRLAFPSSRYVTVQVAFQVRWKSGSLSVALNVYVPVEPSIRFTAPKIVTSGGVKVRFGALRPPSPWPPSFRDDFDDGDDDGWTR